MLEITGTHMEFLAEIKHFCIDLAHSKVEQSNYNHTAEGDIGHLKKRFWQNMVSKKVSNQL